MYIGIDIDNILTNTTECVIKYINERIPNINLKMEDVTDYWMEDILPPEYEWIAEMAFDDKKMWKNVEMIEGAAQVLKKLYDEGHVLFFVTATTAENFRKKISFLSRNLPFLPDGYIKQHAISIKKKQLLNLDIMIDDYLNNLKGLRLYYSICLEYPWNKTDDEIKNFSYAKDWIEIYQIIDNLNKQNWAESKNYRLYLGKE